MSTTFGRRWARGVAAAAGALLVGLACGTTQGSGSGAAANVPGVTSSEILIGTTTPLSGAASAYATISRGSTAYFDYLNAHGGVNGRKITYKVYDDAYDPSKSVPLVRQLITQDQVFAVFNELGTPVNLATRDYINSQKVPDLFVATGSSHWSADYKQFPWTIGYQPDYPSESKIYAKDILSNHPNAKIGVLYQNDDYGMDYLNGLKTGLGSKASTMIVDTESYEANAADVFSQTAALKSKGADLLFIAATPKFAAQAIATSSKLGWNPTIYLNSVSNQVATVKGAIAASSPNAAEGMTSVAYLKDPANQAKWGNDAGMKLYMSIMAQFCAGCDAVNDGNYIYGMSVAWAFQRVLEKAGKNGVTRDNVMKQAASMKNFPIDTLLPGITVTTSDVDYAPLQAVQLQRFNGKQWELFGDVMSSEK